MDRQRSMMSCFFLNHTQYRDKNIILNLPMYIFTFREKSDVVSTVTYCFRESIYWETWSKIELPGSDTSQRPICNKVAAFTLWDFCVVSFCLYHRDLSNIRLLFLTRTVLEKSILWAFTNENIILNLRTTSLKWISYSRNNQICDFWLSNTVSWS